jgi:cyanophycinase-like exopeptidase
MKALWVVVALMVAGCASVNEVEVATAARPAACLSEDQIIAIGADAEPDARVIAVTGSEAKNLGAGIAEATGVAFPEGGSFIVFDKGAVTVWVVLFDRGCMAKQGEFLASDVARWIKGERA